MKYRGDLNKRNIRIKKNLFKIQMPGYAKRVDTAKLLPNLGQREYSGDLKSDHLKSRVFEGRISIGPVFKWSNFRKGFSYSPNRTIQNPDILFWISNDWAFRF